MLLPIWQPGYPWGTDSWGHIQRAASMGRTIREHGLLTGFAQSEWMPDWYMGDPMRVYYPPLTVWILGPLTALVGDVFVAYRIFVTSIFLILGVSVYTIGVQWGRNAWLAVGGAFLSVMAPYTLHTIFAEGNLPRGLALLALPWLVWYTDRILVQKVSHRLFALLSVLWTFAILAHVMQAAIFALVIGLYVLLSVLRQVYIPLRRAFLALLPIIFGAGIAAAYIIPAYSHAELNNVPSLPGAKIEIFSITPCAVLPYQANIEAISIGLAGLVLALLVTFLIARPYQKSLLGVGLLCIILAFGPASGIFQLVPLNQSLLPERFLNVSAIFFPLIVATIPIGQQRRRWLLAGIVLVLVIDFIPAQRVIHMRTAASDQVALAEKLAQGEDSGRIAPLTFPDPTAQQIYLTSEIGKHENISGWALENSPHQDMIRRVLAAMKRSPGYLQRVLSLWNTDYLLTRFDDPTQKDVILSQLPYQPVSNAGEFGLWQRTVPSAFGQMLPDNRMLIIGNNPTSWLFAFPFASEGEFPDPTVYTPEYLNHFSVIGLNRIADNTNVAAALGDWVRRGNTLIVDLSGLGAIYEQGYTLFDVHAIPLVLNGDYAIDWTPNLEAMPASLGFKSPEGGWTAATYYGLDGIVASLTHQGQTYPLLGYHDVGEGRVWYISFNLLYLLDETGQQKATQMLVNYLLTDSSVNRDLSLPPLNMQTLERQPDHLRLQYKSDSNINAVLSMTYFPRWQARVGDQPVVLNSHEHLMLLSLPAGTHTVTLDYRPYSGTAFWSGWGVSLFFIVATIMTIGLLRRYPQISVDERLHSFDERLPPSKATPRVEYVHAPCPNCEFPFATEGPPNDRTYPFFSLECPICGFSLDHEGLIQGETMRATDKREKVAMWLKKSNMSEEQLTQLFGIEKLDKLFSELDTEYDA